MRATKVLIIIGLVIIILGVIFLLQSKSSLGPSTSFMYSNPEWTVNGYIIIAIGFSVIGVGVITRQHSKKHSWVESWTWKALNAKRYHTIISKISHMPLWESNYFRKFTWINYCLLSPWALWRVFISSSSCLLTAVFIPPVPLFFAPLLLSDMAIIFRCASTIFWVATSVES